MKARDIKKGMTIDTGQGVKTVQSSMALNPRVWRVAFTDCVTIFLGPYDSDLTVLTQPPQPAENIAAAS
jgi:hypothetical protein